MDETDYALLTDVLWPNLDDVSRVVFWYINHTEIRECLKTLYYFTWTVLVKVMCTKQFRNSYIIYIAITSFTLSSTRRGTIFVKPIDLFPSFPGTCIPKFTGRLAKRDEPCPHFYTTFLKSSLTNFLPSWPWTATHICIKSSWRGGQRFFLLWT